MKKFAFLLSVLLTLCAFGVPAGAESSGSWSYNVNAAGEAEITGYTGSAADIEIPAELDGHPVTGIGALAFYNNAFLTDVTIPGSVKTIGESAFSFCPGLKKAAIGDGVSVIGMYAFAQCRALTEVTVPDSVETIGEMAFGYYTPDEANFLRVPGFTLRGGAGHAAERYANENGFAFRASGEAADGCLHDALICENCQAKLTKAELLAARGDDLDTGSTLSEGSLTILCTIASAAIFGLGGFVLGRKKRTEK